MSKESSDLQKIQMELKAPKSKWNSFGKYNYRSCEDILEGVKPLLSQYNCNLVITDSVTEVGPVVVISAEVIFTDSTGKETRVKAHAGVELQKKGMDVAQTFGTSSSYARKYALNGLFLIDDTKDADSEEYHNQAQGNQRSQNQQQNQSQQRNNQNRNNQQPSNQGQQQNSALAQQQQEAQKKAASQALADIKNATDPAIVRQIVSMFKNSPYGEKIKQQALAKAEMEGWSKQPKQGQTAQ